MKSLPIKMFTVHGKLCGRHLISNGIDLYCMNADSFPQKNGYWEIELTEQGFVITNLIEDVC